MSELVGRRLPDGDFPEREGDYSKCFMSQPDGSSADAWLIRAPGVQSCCIIGNPNRDGSPYHWVRENDDGTITVEPNPPDAPPERRNSNSILYGGWHGYIYAGVWSW